MQKRQRKKQERLDRPSQRCFIGTPTPCTAHSERRPHAHATRLERPRNSAVTVFQRKFKLFNQCTPHHYHCACMRTHSIHTTSLHHYVRGTIFISKFQLFTQHTQLQARDPLLSSHVSSVGQLKVVETKHEDTSPQITTSRTDIQSSFDHDAVQ
jgi:hypothetical protein